MPELPVLDEALCNGCRDCVFLCPANCLEMIGAIPWLPRPHDCVSCALCAAVCPTDAIKMALPEPA